MPRRITLAVCLLLCTIASISQEATAQKRRRPASTANASPSRESALTSEARRLAAQFWSKYLIKCGASSFLYTDDRLFESRDKPQFNFNGQAHQPKPLSRAEILNGVDPLPIEWDGSIGVNFGLCRMNTSYYGYGQTFWHGWSKWNSNSCGFSTRLTKAKGQWNLPQAKQTSCEQISKWGFVVIPEGVRGAAAERRAEFDAATTAMLNDAPNFGIYMSQNPQFPINYFRAIYSRAKRERELGNYNGGLFKAKLFPGDYYVFFDKKGEVYPGNTSDFRLPPRMAEMFRKYNGGMREAAIGPNNWIEILPHYGVGESYDFEGENIPQTLVSYLKALFTNEYNQQINRQWRPRLIALGPDDQWVMFYGQNRWGCNCRDDVQKALQIAQSVPYILKQFIYTKEGEWLALYGPRFFANSPGFPKDIIDKLTELNRQNIDFDQVLMGPNGSWMIGGKFIKGEDWDCCLK